MELTSIQDEPSIKYCLLSVGAVCFTALFIVVGTSLITQHRFQDFPHDMLTVVGVSFLCLAFLSTLLALVFKMASKHHARSLL